MRKILLACALALTPLSACATLPTSPAVVANTTTLDEQGAIAVGLGYKIFRIAVETGINAGIIKGSLATKVAALDNQLFTAVTAVDAAYQAGNAASLATALAKANRLLASGNTLLARTGSQ